MKPTIGRIVIYNTTESDREELKICQANVQEQLPAVIVSVWNEKTVNLHVLLDGTGNLWKTSVEIGNSEGNWNWPAKVN